VWLGVRMREPTRIPMKKRSSFTLEQCHMSTRPTFLLLCFVGCLVAVCSTAAGDDDDLTHEHDKAFQEPPKHTKCQCFSCCVTCFNGLKQGCQERCPVCKDCAAFCSGPSVGCSRGGTQGACFGQNTLGDGGDCVCSSGQFENPEIYSLGGVVRGLLPVMRVELVATVTPAAQESGDSSARWPLWVNKNGAFEFPYKMAHGRAYTVTTGRVGT
jgi:hypothetical protein